MPNERVDLSDAGLDKLQALCDAATPEPWIYDGAAICIGRYRHMLRADGVGLSREDAQYIAAAREALPAALKELKDARAEAAGALEAAAHMLEVRAVEVHMQRGLEHEARAMELKAAAKHIRALAAQKGATDGQ